MLINERYSEESQAEQLPFWSDFLQKFKMFRNRNRRETDSDVYPRLKDKDLFHDELPYCTFLDEWDLESINRNWKSGHQKSRKYGSADSFNTISFSGLENPEIGDILITFRNGAWLFKPDANFNYRYSSSARWAYDDNYWDDVKYMDEFCKNYRFKLDKHEVPVIFRTRATQKIRPTAVDGDPGYKLNRRRTKTSDGYTYESNNKEIMKTNKIMTLNEYCAGCNMGANPVELDETILDELVELVGSEEDVELAAAEAHQELMDSFEKNEIELEGDEIIPEKLAIISLILKLVEMGKLGPEEADQVISNYFE